MASTRCPPISALIFERRSPTPPPTRPRGRRFASGSLATVLEWGDQLAEGQQLPATSLVRAAEHGVHLRPDQALLDVDDANLIRLAVFVWPNRHPTRPAPRRRRRRRHVACQSRSARRDLVS